MMQSESGQFADHHRHETLIVPEIQRSMRMDAHLAVRIVVQNHDIGHAEVASHQIGCRPYSKILFMRSRFFGSCERICLVRTAASFMCRAAAAAVPTLSCGWASVRNPMPYRTY